MGSRGIVLCVVACCSGQTYALSNIPMDPPVAPPIPQPKVYIPRPVPLPPTMPSWLPGAVGLPLLLYPNPVGPGSDIPRGPQPPECSSGTLETGCSEPCPATFSLCGRKRYPQPDGTDCDTNLCIGTDVTPPFPEWVPPFTYPDGMPVIPPEWVPPVDLPWAVEEPAHKFPFPDEIYPDPVPEVELPPDQDTPGETTSNPDGSTRTEGMKRQWSQPDPAKPEVEVRDIPYTTTRATPEATPQTTLGPSVAPAPALDPLEMPDQCRDHPETLGCAGAGVVPEAPVLPTRDVDVSFNPSSSNASCPSPETFIALGRTYSLSYNYLCDFAVMIKPIVISIALVAALAIILM